MVARSRREKNGHAPGLSTGTPQFEESGMLVGNAKIIVEMIIGGSFDAGY
jgi:hypothetical protein